MLLLVVYLCLDGLVNLYLLVRKVRLSCWGLVMCGSQNVTILGFLLGGFVASGMCLPFRLESN